VVTILLSLGCSFCHLQSRSHPISRRLKSSECNNVDVVLRCLVTFSTVTLLTVVARQGLNILESWLSVGQRTSICADHFACASMTSDTLRGEHCIYEDVVVILPCLSLLSVVASGSDSAGRPDVLTNKHLHTE
jgi:hypothetical protein